MKQCAVTRHKPGRLNFERCKTIDGGVDNKWQSDLCDMQGLSANNGGFNFLLVNVDVFFKISDCCSVEK